MPANPNMLIRGKAVDVLTSAAPKLIYGTIVLSATIAALRDPPPPAYIVIALSVSSLVAIAVAGSYAELIRHDMARQEVTPLREKGRILFRPTWVLASAAVPTLWFSISAAGLLSPEGALVLTKATLVFILAFFGFIARRLCGGGWFRSTLAGLTIAAFGATVIQLKVWIKYLPDIFD